MSSRDFVMQFRKFRDVFSPAKLWYARRSLPEKRPRENRRMNLISAINFAERGTLFNNVTIRTRLVDDETIFPPVDISLFLVD